MEKALILDRKELERIFIVWRKAEKAGLTLLPEDVEYLSNEEYAKLATNYFIELAETPE